MQSIPEYPIDWCKAGDLLKVKSDLMIFIDYEAYIKQPGYERMHAHAIATDAHIKFASKTVIVTDNFYGAIQIDESSLWWTPTMFENIN